jgi:hypothetical protein
MKAKRKSTIPEIALPWTVDITTCRKNALFQAVFIAVGCALALCLMLAACGGNSASKNETPGRTSAASPVFRQPDVPFTFSYPPEFFSNASLQFRFGQDGTQGAKPEYYLELEKNNGIGVKQIGSTEASNDGIIEHLRSTVLQNKTGTLRVERWGGRDLVMIEMDIQFAYEPARSWPFKIVYVRLEWKVLADRILFDATAAWCRRPRGHGCHAVDPVPGRLGQWGIARGRRTQGVLGGRRVPRRPHFRLCLGELLPTLDGFDSARPGSSGRS